MSEQKKINIAQFEHYTSLYLKDGGLSSMYFSSSNIFKHHNYQAIYLKSLIITNIESLKQILIHSDGTIKID